MLRLQTDVKGEGTPLVLVGGGLTGWLSWVPHQERLASTRQVVRVQPLSVQYGLEDQPLPPHYGLKMESDVLAGSIAQLGLGGPVDLAAWSYGAAITLDYALDHPDQVRTLALIEPPAFWVLEATGRLDVESKRQRDEMLALYAGMTRDVTEDQLATFVCQAGRGNRLVAFPPPDHRGACLGAARLGNARAPRRARAPARGPGRLPGGAGDFRGGGRVAGRQDRRGSGRRRGHRAVSRSPVLSCGLSNRREPGARRRSHRGEHRDAIRPGPAAGR